MTRAINLHLMACGHEIDVEKACDAEQRVIDFLEGALEDLQKEAK